MSGSASDKTVRRGAARARSAPACSADIQCFDTVPSFLAADLDALYQHLNSSFRHHVFRERASSARAYVARGENGPLAIFLFHIERKRLRVLNELVAIPTAEIERFVRFAFERFPSISTISFSLIDNQVGALRLPCQQHGHSEDVVVSLPASPEAYLASLGSKTRYNIRHQLKALARDYPQLQFITLEGHDIQPRQVRELIALKHSNTDDKGIAFGISPEETAWLVHEACIDGLLLIAVEDGRIRGGSLSLRLGDHYFAHVVAYAPPFARYSLGMLCCYLAMQEKIARKAKEAHLSWGRQDYKFKLRGVQRDMANLDIYRSYFAYWRHAHRLAGHAAAGYAASAKRALLACEQGQGRLAALARSVVGGMRAMKRAAYRTKQTGVLR
jgi:CelD/BcsL family acetyltransferase involved in cellulose biosynthesis